MSYKTNYYYFCDTLKFGVKIMTTFYERQICYFMQTKNSNRNVHIIKYNHE